MNLTVPLFLVGGVAVAVAVMAGVRSLSRKLDRQLILTTLAGAGIGLAVLLLVTRGLLAFCLALALTVGVGVAWVVWRRGGTARTVTRWGERTRRRSGVATPWQILRVASGWAMHRKAGAVRPHLREVGWRERWRTPTTELAVELCRTARMRVWAAVEDVILVLGGPRTGKTAWLANPVIDAPGAVVTTSTRTDVLKLTRELRAKRGPVLIYNPGGLADLPSTITFDPVHGCDNPVTAIERAVDMLPEQDAAEGERGFWDSQARRVLAALLHAAGLSSGARDASDILRWVAAPDENATELQLLLRRSPMKSFATDVEQFIRTNNTTRSSITSGVMPVLQWLSSPAAVDSTKGTTPFDVAELLRTRGTVYLLGRHEANTAPLLAALTGYIAREARRLAAALPGGRLDPPLLLALDEAARVSPVPLPDWSGDFGGSGVQLICAFQSRADIINGWGPIGAARILNNTGSLMLLGGTKDTGDLKFFSELAGDRDEPVVTRNGDGKVTSTTVRKTPILAVAQLANLPEWRAVVYARGMPVTVGRISRAWKRADVRAIARTARPAPARPAAEVASLPDAAPIPAPAPTGAPVSPARELTDVAH